MVEVTTMQESWKITDFVKQVHEAVGEKKPSRNTIDTWFKELDARRIHYVNKDTFGERLYDSQDLKIALWMRECRQQRGWSLEGIFDALPHAELELRPFPPDYESVEKDIQVVDIQQVQTALMIQVESKIDSANRELEWKLRQQRITDLITEKRVMNQLEREALQLWATKPIQERFVKVGWFKKAEDTSKRDAFVKDYVSEKFEDRMLEALGLEQKE